MIALHPRPDICLECPICHVGLQVHGWRIPGMRSLADLSCPRCRREFYGDLPAGHGLLYPMLLEKASGTIYDANDRPWFAQWLHDSYARQTDMPTGFHTEENRPLRNPILLNCLDRLYGHCLLKLLNAQYYIDQRPDLDLIVLVPRFLRWLVPEGAAAVWTVDLPLNRGTEWNNRLAGEIKRQIEPLGHCFLSAAFSHPHPADFQIERFTGIAPFPSAKWEDRSPKPAITFIWREDRFWDRLAPARNFPERAARRITRALPLGLSPLQRQKRHVLRLAQKLRRALPQMDFAVVGLGRPGGFPGWITDLRTPALTEKIERDWCRRYSQSHIVIGIHGSNMLLPSAHAGAVLELVPDDHRGNLGQDILLNAQTTQEALIRCQLLSQTVSASNVATAALLMLEDMPFTLMNFARPWNDHETVETDPCRVTRKYHQTKNRIFYP